jgi:hypothetical protein
MLVASIACEVNQERECMCISWCGHCMSFPTTRRDWQRWRWREVAAAKRCVYYWSSTLKKNQRQSSLRWASSCGSSAIGVGWLVAATKINLVIRVPPTHTISKILQQWPRALSSLAWPMITRLWLLHPSSIGSNLQLLHKYTCAHILISGAERVSLPEAP